MPTVTEKELLQSCTSSTALERERSLKKIEAILREGGLDSPGTQLFRQKSLDLLSGSPKWEQRYAGLRIVLALLAAGDHDGAFASQLMDLCWANLEHEEPRVRLTVAEVLEQLALLRGLEVWRSTKAALLHSIQANFDRSQADAPDGSECPSAQRARRVPAPTSASFVSSLLAQSYKVERPGTGDMRHGTEGWRALETSYKALHGIIRGTGRAFAPVLLGRTDCPSERDEAASLRRLLIRGTTHPNRFVREISHLIWSTIFGSGVLTSEELLSYDYGTTIPSDAVKDSQIADATTTGREISSLTISTLADQRTIKSGKLCLEIAPRLALGMTDSWDMVRYAAASAAISLLKTIPRGAWPQFLATALLPPLCLNRHCEAEGVRALCQRGWREALGPDGRAWLARCAPAVASYYNEQCRAVSHAVRQAACLASAEFIQRVSPAATRPHTPALLRALASCARDASWPVRDAAVLASGRATRAAPEEALPLLPHFLALWSGALLDAVPTVREGAAIAFGDALSVFEDDQGHNEDDIGAEPRDSTHARQVYDAVLEQALLKLDSMLLEAKQQPPDTTSSSMISQEEGVLESTAQQFSWGVLAPALQRGADCCIDHGYTKEQEPWEASDGAVYLLREVTKSCGRPGSSSNTNRQMTTLSSPPNMARYLPDLAELARIRHFSSSATLQQTIWGALPEIAQVLGKRTFKPVIEDFLGSLFAALGCDQPLVSAAAGKCVGALRDWLGPGVWAARLEPDQLALQQASPDVPPPAGKFVLTSGGNPTCY